ncbi:MAG: alanine racemase [Robinsoniella sp.]|nr:alanine racemase [Robinsoniella sp.]
MSMKQPLFRDTFLEIDLDCIAFNIRQIRAAANPGVCIAAVIKANGYGHGALEIAPVLMENGADMLAVATLGEALELRQHYPSYPILLMGLTPDDYLPYVVKNQIIQTIDRLSQARRLSQLAFEYGTTALVHIKVDTGFHRIGFPDTPQALEEMKEIFALPNLTVQGIFSHLALTSEEENERQFQRFLDVISALEAAGCRCPYHHIADSISFVDYPEYQLNMIRPGAILYGLKGFHIGHLDLKQALSFKTKISHISHIKKGEGVGYDYLWRAERDSIIGTLPFGYADGYPRNMRDKGFVSIHGQKAPLIGVLCMDQCMVDLTDIADVHLGDEAIIYGNGEHGTLDIDSAAKLAGTNKNEIVSRLTARPPRVYKKDGAITKVVLGEHF